MCRNEKCLAGFHAYAVVVTKVVDSSGGAGTASNTAVDGVSLHLVNNCLASRALRFSLRRLNHQPIQAVASAAAAKQPRTAAEGFCLLVEGLCWTAFFEPFDCKA